MGTNKDIPMRKDMWDIDEYSGTLDQYYINYFKQLNITPCLNEDRIEYPFTLLWEGTDNEPIWYYTKSGQLHPTVRDSWNSKGYDTNIPIKKIVDKYTENPIEYVLNSDGFRTVEIDDWGDVPVSIALGCSHTFGTGIHEEDTWVKMLEKHIDTPLLNLAVPGSGVLTHLRVLLNVYKRLNIKNVFLFSPYEHQRWEWQDYDFENDRETYFIWTPYEKRTAHLPRILSNERNSTFMKLMAYSSITHFCNYHNIPLYSIATFNPFIYRDFTLTKDNIDYILGRDLRHGGLFQQENVLQTFLNKLKKTQ